MGMTRLERAARAMSLCDPDMFTREMSENPCPDIPLEGGEVDEIADGMRHLSLKAWRLYARGAAEILDAFDDGGEPHGAGLTFFRSMTCKQAEAECQQAAAALVKGE